MEKYVQDLTEEEKDQFNNHFYNECGPTSKTDQDSPCPWGSPWYWAATEILKGETIQEMAENFYKKVEGEMLDLLKEEEEED